MEVEDRDLASPRPCEALGCVAGPESFGHPVHVGESTDEKDGSADIAREARGARRHAALAQDIAGSALPGERAIGRRIAGVAHTQNRVGIRKRVAVGGVGIQVEVDERHRDAALGA